MTTMMEFNGQEHERLECLFLCDVNGNENIWNSTNLDAKLEVRVKLFNKTNLCSIDSYLCNIQCYLSFACPNNRAQDNNKILVIFSKCRI